MVMSSGECVRGRVRAVARASNEETHALQCARCDGRTHLRCCAPLTVCHGALDAALQRLKGLCRVPPCVAQVWEREGEEGGVEEGAPLGVAVQYLRSAS
jgi:hypothetical protein